MANEVFFAGGRIDSLGVVGAPVETTSAGRFNATYADSATAVLLNEILTANFLTTSGTVMAAADALTGETVYAHFDFYIAAAAASTSGVSLAALHDSSGFPWLAIRTNSTALGCGFFHNSGTGAAPVWTQMGASFTLTSAVLYTFDMKLTLGAPHTAELSQNGSVLIAATTFTQAALTSLRSLRLSGISSSLSSYSQVLCTSNLSTIGGFVRYSRATGAGTNAGWTGAFTDVNEAVGSDTTVNTSTVSAQKQTYAMGDVTVPSGFVIQTVFQFLRAKNNGAVPTNIRSVLRSAAIDYPSGNLTSPTFGTSFQPMGMRYNNDPATAASWTTAGWNAAEAGFESFT